MSPFATSYLRVVLQAHEAGRVVLVVSHLASAGRIVAGLRAILRDSLKTEASNWFRAQGTPEARAVADAVDDVLYVLDLAHRHLDTLADAGERLHAALRAWSATQPRPSAPGGDA